MKNIWGKINRQQGRKLQLTLVFSAFGLLIFLAGVTALPFKDRLLTSLYPKPISEAAPPIPMKIGFNTTGITHYGYTEALPYAPASHIEADLTEIKRMGGTIVRVAAANKYISAEESARRLDIFLTTAESYSISAIVFFAGLIKDDTGLYPQNIESYYTNNWNGMFFLNHDFFSKSQRHPSKSCVTSVHILFSLRILIYQPFFHAHRSIPENVRL